MAAAQRKPPAQILYSYGLQGPPGLLPWQVEAEAFRLGRTPERGGLGRFGHLHRWLSLMWPQEVCTRDHLVCEPCRNLKQILHPERWNPWTEQILRELCGDENAHIIGGNRVKSTMLTGNAAASKTYTCGLYAFAYFACLPQSTIVMATSTTKDMVKKRIWPIIQRFHDTALTGLRGETPWAGFLNKIDSQTTIKFIPPEGTSPSDKNAIFAMAVAHGETQKAASNLKGLHDARMLLLIDEANDTPPAIFEVIPNQLKACTNYEIIVVGNPVSRLDNHGRACAPVQGWNTIDEGSFKWLTKGVDEWELESGTCLRFDGKESPNVKLGRDRWPFLYTCANWVRASAPGKAKSLGYWQHSRGLWPPPGFCNTIMDEVMLEKYDPLDGPSFTWLSRKEGAAFLDSGFGGDTCVLAFGEFGDIENSKTGLQITELLELSFEQASQDEKDYLIARQCIEECKRRQVRSCCFGLDRTGTGRGVAAIVCAEWSSDIVQVEYGGRPTDRPSSTADGRPSHEVYSNRVTEMWWSSREWLEAGQLRGIPLKARIQLSAREYTSVGRRYKLEPKDDYKERTRSGSPDEADATTGLVDVVRMQGFSAVTRNATSTNTSWERMIDKQVQASEQDVQELEGAVPGQFRPASVMDMFEDAVEAGWD